MPTPSAALSLGSFDLLSVFNAQPGATLLLSPEWVILGASDDYLAATLTERATLVGQNIFDAFPDNPETPEANAVANVRASLEQVLANKQPHEMPPQHYDVPDPERPSCFVERHWQLRHTPVLNAAGQVQFLIQSVQDITARRWAERELRESQAREQAARAEVERQRGELERLFEQAPVAMALYQGPDYLIELANQPMATIWGRTLAQVLGQPVFTVLPYVRNQGFEALFADVLAQGTEYNMPEVAVTIDRAQTNQPTLGYFNLTYRPQRGSHGQITGIFTIAQEVTEQVLARQRVEQLNQELEVRVQERTQAMHQQQTQLEFILSQIPAAVALLTGPDQQLSFFNDAFRALSGGRAHAGLPVADVFPEAAEQGFLGLLAQVYTSGEPYSSVDTLVELHDPASGQRRRRYLDLLYQPLPDAQGQPARLLVFVVDMTEKVLARQRSETLQAQLLAAAQRQAAERLAFQSVFEQTPALIALLRQPGHRYEYVNPAYQALFPGRQLVGRELAECAPELVAQGFGALLDQVFQTGETFLGAELPFTPVSAAGQAPRLHYFNFTYQAYREDGQIAGVTIFAFDVTEQVLARQQREAERQQLHDLFMEAPAPVVILDGPDLVYQLVNPAYQRIFPGRDLLGKALLQALPELGVSPIPGVLQHVYATGETYVAQELPLQLARHEGAPLEQIYWTFTYQARRNAHGTVDGVLVFAHEVTDQVLARRVVEEGGQQARASAERLAAANEQLTRVNVDLDNFIYTASHDLKAPISNIEGLLYLLQEELPAAITQTAHVESTLLRMLDSVERFKRTIDHLTDVSKLQKEHHVPAQAAVNLAAVVEDVRQDLAPLLLQTGAKLVVDVTARPLVQFSEKNLRSIVYNLLSNALKYHSPDRAPRLDVRTHVRSGYTVLEVHDNGLGMAATHLPKLFGMFQRFHDHVDGSGIGLYMVKRIVENAGGRIDVHSVLGAGTTFFVHLPHAPGSAAAYSFPS